MNQDVAGFDDIELSELRRRRSYKWRLYGGDVLPAFVAEMDYPLAPPVEKALRDMADRGDCGYAYDIDELGAALRSFTQRRWSWAIEEHQVTLVPDVMVGVLEMLRLMLQPGDAVVVNTPVYPPFFEHIEEAGCRVVEAALARSADGHYEYDLDALVHAFEAGARALLLCNPHNPTGLVASKAELERIAGIAQAYDALVISDEIHAPLVLEGAVHTPYLSLGERACERGVALLSASKAWNVAGLKCAQLVAVSDRMQSHVAKLREAVTFRSGIAGIVAGIAAYRDGDGWLDTLLRVLERNRGLTEEWLRALIPQARYVSPQAGYLAWLDCSALGISGNPADFFRERGRVAVLDGRRFGSPGEGFVRVTLGTSRRILGEIFERMAQSLR